MTFSRNALLCWLITDLPLSFPLHVYCPESEGFTVIVREGFSLNDLPFFRHSKDQSSELSSNPQVRVIFSFGKNSVQFGSAASFGLGVSEEGNKINVHFRCRTPNYSTIKNYDL